MRTAFDGIALIATVIAIVWTYSYVIWSWVGKQRSGRTKNLLIELKYPFIVSEVICQAQDTVITSHHGWMYWLFGLARAWWIYAAWQLKDDDRWKKRRQKLAAKVKEVGGKLVVVPMPDPVPIAARTR